MISEQYVKILKQYDLSNTKTRQKVFAILAASSTPLSMRELFELAKIDRVSVYRTIDTFEKIGIVKRIHSGWKYKIELGEAFHAHHHHLTCISCSKIVEFKEPEGLDDSLEALSIKQGFLLQQHVLELRGVCSTCQKGYTNL